MGKKTQPATGLSYGNDKILELEIGSIRSHSLENFLWKGLRTCRKTDYAINEVRQSTIKLCKKDLQFMCTRTI
jgi:hypothetical protein